MNGDAELARVFALLRRAKRDRRSDWRNVQLASLAADGSPRGRTVVLRDVNEDERSFAFWTDRRSPKADEIAADPRVALTFWDGRSRQLRAAGTATIAGTEDPDVRSLLASLPDRALADYASIAAPGAASDDGTANDLRAAAEANFARVNVRAHELDLLVLAREGHHRWRFDRDAGARSVQP